MTASVLRGTARVLALLLLLAGTSSADSVVVLPLTTSDRSLSIYERASANALAKRLAEGLGTSVNAPASASDVGKDAVILIDARILLAGDERIKLEARVRRVATGKSIQTVATRSMAITDLDTLVTELAQALAPTIVRALARAEVIVLPTTVVQGTRVPAMEEALAQRPHVLLLTPRGQVAHGIVSVIEPASAGAFDMLDRMDMRVARSELGPIADSLTIAAELQSRGASYALLVDVKKVRFSYQGVLSARGTVRLAMIGKDGRSAFDKVVHTHTVVGSRGDRHQAIVYRVVDQAFDMVLPQLNELAAKELL